MEVTKHHLIPRAPQEQQQENDHAQCNAAQPATHTRDHAINAFCRQNFIKRRMSRRLMANSM
jgi:hypothetical protein